VGTDSSDVSLTSSELVGGDLTLRPPPIRDALGRTRLRHGVGEHRQRRGGAHGPPAQPVWQRHGRWAPLPPRFRCGPSGRRSARGLQRVFRPGGDLPGPAGATARTGRELQLRRDGSVHRARHGRERPDGGTASVPRTGTPRTCTPPWTTRPGLGAGAQALTIDAACSGGRSPGLASGAAPPTSSGRSSCATTTHRSGRSGSTRRLGLPEPARVRRRLVRDETRERDVDAAGFDWNQVRFHVGLRYGFGSTVDRASLPRRSSGSRGRCPMKPLLAIGLLVAAAGTLTAQVPSTHKAADFSRSTAPRWRPRRRLCAMCHGPGELLPVPPRQSGGGGGHADGRVGQGDERHGPAAAAGQPHAGVRQRAREHGLVPAGVLRRLPRPPGLPGMPTARIRRLPVAITSPAS